jgi:hypothetical protein
VRGPVRFAVAALVVVAVVALTAALFLWRTLSRPLVVDAPVPVVAPEAPDTVSPPRPSIIEAPVTYDLKTAIDSLDAAVPRVYGDIERRIQAGNNRRAHFAFAVARNPFRVHVNGQTVEVSTEVEYEGRVWYRPLIGPEIRASCGTDGVLRPRVVATLASTARLTPQWQVRTRTRLVRLEPYSLESRDRCRLTIFRIDVTNRVMDATRRMLEQNLARFDSAVTRWRVRPRFEQLWRQLQRPIRFTDSVYLIIQPFAAELGSVGAVGDTLAVARLRLIASPRVITGGHPNEFELLEPMPLLGRAERVGSGARVAMDASFSYPVASVLLRRVLVGRTVEQQGHRVRVDDVELTGIGGGRVALGVTLAGAVRGRLYFTGTPLLDAVNRQVYVPDLDYDVGSLRALVRGFEWLRGVDIRDFLRERARLPDSALIGKLRELAERGMNRTLSPGVVLSARIDRAQGTAVFATTREIRVRAVAEAELKLAISKPPSLSVTVPAPGKGKNDR